MHIYIEGKITIEDYRPEHDKTSKFCIDTDNQWLQWGATHDRLCESVPIVEAMANTIAAEF